MINADTLEVEVSSVGTLEGDAYQNISLEGEINTDSLETEISTAETIEGEVSSNNTIEGEVNNINVVYIEITYYNNSYNKPKINGVELLGNKTLDELDIQVKGDYPEEMLTNSDIEALIKNFV